METQIAEAQVYLQLSPCELQFLEDPVQIHYI